jgi:hypothetical protein
MPVCDQGSMLVRMSVLLSPKRLGDCWSGSTKERRYHG